jgi:hypothetical protein
MSSRATEEENGSTATPPASATSQRSHETHAHQAITEDVRAAGGGSDGERVEIYLAPGAQWVGSLKLMSISATCMSLFFLPVAAFMAPAGKLGAAAKVFMSGAIATVAVSTTGALPSVRLLLLMSPRCACSCHYHAARRALLYDPWCA